MKLNCKQILTSAAILAVLFGTVGCKAPASHPNQISSFDGVAYDSLTVTRAALQAMRTPIATDYPEYTTVFNEITVAYNDASSVYALYHSGRTSEAQITAAVQQMVISFLLLDSKLLASLGSPSAARPHAISSLQLITELQVLAAVAARVPAVAQEAGLAEVILSGSAEAELALEAVTNQPIALSTLVRVPTI